MADRSDMDFISLATRPRTDPAPYCAGVKWGGLLFISGQVPIDYDTGTVPESFDAQVRQVFRNMTEVAMAAGTNLSRALKIVVYLTDIRNFDEMNSIYCELLSDPRPARTTVEVGLHGFLIEADAIVSIPE
jgi:2-iminobutanoate/2-iminopropanoate deaminase